ncbi:MAG: D-Ala-D-Ala carboxypeptidase family metallohydrolase [Reyranellaceae bacterium]
MPTQLSQHFSLEEFIRSDTAQAMGEPNLPTPEHRKNLEILADHMEKVRDLFGVPVLITSGYRNPKVNAAVGGVPNSDHAVGLAADFHVDGIDDLHAARKIRDSTLNFDQLILERGRCVHMSFVSKMRRQVLRQPGGPGSTVFDGLE